VSFLDRETGPDIEQDWLPALAVSVLMRKDELVEQLKAHFANEHSPGFDFSDDDVTISGRQSVVEMWKSGLRQYVLRQIETERTYGLDKTGRPIMPPPPDITHDDDGGTKL
jgi:hypothetical protein